MRHPWTPIANLGDEKPFLSFSRAYRKTCHGLLAPFISLKPVQLLLTASVLLQIRPAHILMASPMRCVILSHLDARKELGRPLYDHLDYGLLFSGSGHSDLSSDTSTYLDALPGWLTGRATLKFLAAKEATRTPPIVRTERYQCDNVCLDIYGATISNPSC